jgi:hypothetical protein
MLDDTHTGKDGKGVWLWTLASGLILFVMEFILFAALVPTDWARQVAARELASLVATVGPETAAAILARAAGWYDALFIRTGLQAGSFADASSECALRFVTGCRSVRGRGTKL